jgi:hypothetical protein
MEGFSRAGGPTAAKGLSPAGRRGMPFPGGLEAPYGPSRGGHTWMARKKAPALGPETALCGDRQISHIPLGAV